MAMKNVKSVLLFSTLVLAACTSVSDRRVPAPAALPTTIRASVAHRDPRTSAPTFLWINRKGLPRFETAREAATEVVRGVARAFGLPNEASLAPTEIDERGGSVVARFEQRAHGLPVFRGGLSVLLTSAYEPIAASGHVAPRLDGADRPFAIDESAATIAAASAARVTSLVRPARVDRMLFPDHDGRGVEPAYYVELWFGKSDARSYVISANDGRVLFENDLVHHEAFKYRVYADPTSLIPLDGPQGMSLTPHPTGLPDKKTISYVPSVPITLQNFPFSKNDPWLGSGSTETRGNNVRSYRDAAEPDGVGGTDLFATTTSANAFEHVYDTAQSPGASAASINASVTQLFYVMNFLHDWFYDAGFDEAARNHQQTNYQRGGLQNDALLAEAHDFSGRNNANAAVPADGSSPRIQMFIFSGASSASLVVTAPANVAGTKQVGIASGFGDDNFDFSGTVVLAVDEGGADANDGCEAIGNDVAGKIALIHRGTCSFAQKAQNAQAAGAVGAIIANVASSAQPTIAPFMGGQADNITIPVLSLDAADGAALEAGGTVTMRRFLGADLDGALDTTIVAHEWGHVLSSRLVGNGNGLTTNQAGGLGEGWSDFVSLLMSSRATQAPYGGVYGHGGYATSGAGDDVYFGTRRLPYSVDVTKNALTFKHIANGTPLPSGVPTSFGEDGSFNAEVHNAGEVWSTMLWECYVALLRDSRHTFDEAQRRMKRYLVAGMKLTPLDPTFLEARDALLAATYAADKADFRVFLEAFARRGAGSGAEGPPKDSRTNIGVKESFTTGSDAQIAEVTVTDDVVTCDRDGILDEGEIGNVAITVRNTGGGTLSQAVARVSSKMQGVTIEGGEPTKIEELEPFESATIKVRTSLRGAPAATVIPLDVEISEPTLPAGKVLTSVVAARFHADEAEAAATIDHVDTPRTSWKTAGGNQLGRWARVTEGTQRFWSVPYTPPLQSDHRLQSEPFTLESPSFSISFRHRYSFRFSARRGVDTDGGVVEISVDEGRSWQDVNQFGTADYNSTLDGSRGDNPLRGRKAYGNKSMGYPAQWITSKIDVTLPELPANVLIRFRAGYGSAFSAGTAEGWDIDDIELTGITSKPFFSYVPHQDFCDENAPSVNAGAAQRVRSGDRVTLVGSSTYAFDAPLTHVWTQAQGPRVETTANGPLSISFVAPDVQETTTLSFTLRAHDGQLLSSASTVPVVVDPPGSSLEGGGCGCRTSPVDTRSAPLLAAGALAALFARRRRRNAG